MPGAVSSVPSQTRPHLACPHSICDAIVDPPPVALQAGPGRARFALPAGGPKLEGGGEKGGFDPQDLQSAYAIPLSGAGGQTVALVEAGGPAAPQEELATYRSRYGLPPCTEAAGCFKAVNQTGKPAKSFGDSDEWELEIALDMDMVSAACPECHILLVEANSPGVSDLAAAENTAARLGAQAISNSYGIDERLCEGCASYESAYEHPGVMITASAGDAGFDDAWEGGLAPQFPAISRGVVAVGGTSLRRDSSERGWAEAVWSEPERLLGTGGGCSTSRAKPVWQTDPACAGRTDNDVAAVAACSTPVSVYATFGGGWTDVCGTSASAPLVAAIEAHGSAYAHSAPGASAFYAQPSAFNDVTSGNSGAEWQEECFPPALSAYLCSGEPGYDGPTGNGTPAGPLTVSALPPEVTTEAASGAGASGATLHGLADPVGLATSYRFEYGQTTGYGAAAPVPDGSAGSGFAAVAISTGISGLAAGRTYHYRLVATNAAGTTYGADGQFATAPPVVESVTPGEGPASGGTVVTITGSNLAGATSVKFGSAPASHVKAKPDGTVEATAPTGTGAVDVTVTTAAGTSAPTSADRFSYVEGTVVAWGYNEGALGNGGTEDASRPVEVSALPPARSVAAGGSSSLAALEDGEVMSWGPNYYGENGNGTLAAELTPQHVCAVGAQSCLHGPWLSGVSAVAQGNSQSLALRNDGTVLAWGAGEDGILGTGDATTLIKTPEPVCTVQEFPCAAGDELKNVVAVATGYYSQFALMRDGTVEAWGLNFEGALGIGTETGPEQCGRSHIFCARHPTPIPGLHEVTAIAVASESAYALLRNGTVRSWGDNLIGQLGDGTVARRDAPVVVCAAGQSAPCSQPLRDVAEVGARVWGASALLRNGNVMGWGNDYEGGLGDGEFGHNEYCKDTEKPNCAKVPVRTHISGVVGIGSGGVAIPMAYLADGDLMTWGADYNGERGQGEPSLGEGHEWTDLPGHVCGRGGQKQCPNGPWLNGDVTATSLGGNHVIVSFARGHAPVVTGVAPDSGPRSGGTHVTITGRHLEGASGVSFGGSPATEVEVLSDQEVVAVAPPGEGLADITVSGPGGTSLTGWQDQFLYEATPGAVTEGTSAALQAEARVTGSVTPEGSVTACFFEYGPTTEYGQSIPCDAPPGWGVGPLPEGATLSQLTPETTYHYRIVAVDGEGTGYGEDRTFSTLPVRAPAITGGEATLLGQHVATLSAAVNPQGAQVGECRFEYGPSTEYGQSIPCPAEPGKGTEPVGETVQLAGLTAGSGYHFRLVATNGAGTTHGEDHVFATPAPTFPEIGRCAPASAGHVGYSDARCLNAAPPGASSGYEWQPWPLSKNGFTLTIGKLKVTVSSAGLIPCKSGIGSGEAVGPDTISISLELRHCFGDRLQGACHNAGERGEEITLNPLVAVAVLSKHGIEWRFAPAPGSSATAVTCAGGYSGSIAGSFTAKVKSNANVMASSQSLGFSVKTGLKGGGTFTGAEAWEMKTGP
jgi:alpha-tubulin suppressor-like RCC1 family protein